MTGQGKVITQLRDLKMVLNRTVREEAVDLLEDTIWGTPGGTQYQHLNTPERIRELKNPFFLELWKGEKMLGFLAMAQREGETAGRKHSAFFVRYLAFLNLLQRKTTTDSSAVASGMRSNSIMKMAVRRLFDRPDVLMEATGHDHAVFYAFVELENERSQNMIQMIGFEPIRKFNTLIFSRYSPKKRANIRRATAADHETILARLAEQFAGHSFYTAKDIFYRDNFWIMEEEGEIVAGLQANPVHWVMKNMPGFSGKLIMRVLPHLPFLSRMFNPRKYDFLATEGLFCAPGKEKQLYHLLGHACAENGLKSALMWMDSEDPRQEAIRKGGRLGILQKMNSDTKADVVMRAVGVPENEVVDFGNRPVYISAFDVT